MVPVPGLPRRGAAWLQHGCGDLVTASHAGAPACSAGASAGSGVDYRQDYWAGLLPEDVLHRRGDVVAGPRLGPRCRSNQNGTFPFNRDSTAFALDYLGAFLRGCQEGWVRWLGNDGAALRRRETWGCVGAWYAGAWLTPTARKYVGRVRAALDDRPWLDPDWAAYEPPCSPAYGCPRGRLTDPVAVGHRATRREVDLGLALPGELLAHPLPPAPPSRGVRPGRRAGRAPRRRAPPRRPGATSTAAPSASCRRLRQVEADERQAERHVLHGLDRGHLLLERGVEAERRRTRGSGTPASSVTQPVKRHPGVEPEPVDVPRSSSRHSPSPRTTKPTSVAPAPVHDVVGDAERRGRPGPGGPSSPPSSTRCRCRPAQRGVGARPARRGRARGRCGRRDPVGRGAGRDQPLPRGSR